MSYTFGKVSEQRLVGVHPKLVAVVRRALQLTTVDFMLVEGLRSREQMAVNYGKGRTAAQCQAAGVDPRHAQPKAAKVTWLRDPYNSKHGKQADGFGHAVDLLPAPYDWKDLRGFDAVAKAMLQAADELKTPIKWGADWNQNGKPREKGETDSPHFELAR
jgi:peptidoglycan L-alanyl-D-glutamate endopeptidase CwlK